MKITVIITLTIVALLAGCNSGDTGLSEKQKLDLKSRFYNPNYVMPDTIIHYELYTDSLVLSFQPKANYKYWYTQMILREDYFGAQSEMNNIDLGAYDKHEVKENKIVFRDFHISPDSIDKYVPDFFAFPHIDDGTLVMRNPVENNRIFFWKQGDDKILTPWGPSKKQNYVCFNLNILSELNKEEYDYCFEVLFEETGIQFDELKSSMKK